MDVEKKCASIVFGIFSGQVEVAIYLWGIGITLVGRIVRYDVGCGDEFCVGADRRVRPHRNASLLWMMPALQMSYSLCRGGPLCPPAITEFLSDLTIRL
jgi:hypothetical protein